MCRASVAECPQVQSVHFPILSTFFLISLFNSYSGIMKKVFTLNMYIVHRISYKIYIFVVSEISWNLFFTFFFHVNAEKLLHLVAHFHNSWKFLKPSVLHEWNDFFIKFFLCFSSQNTSTELIGHSLIKNLKNSTRLPYRYKKRYCINLICNITFRMDNGRLEI